MSDQQITTAELSRLLSQFVAAGTDAASAIASKTGLKIEYRHIQEALEERLAPADAMELIYRGLDAQQIVQLLEGYAFEAMFPVLLTEIAFETSIIPPGTQRRLEERTVRAGGEVWRVHKNDADPFPSNPHAHNLESGQKLHLGTGDLYFKNKIVGSVGKKTLKTIRGMLKGFQLPNLEI